jgi:hypothetical protein
MSDSNTIRILSMDGGGMRGYMSLVFLQKFIQQWGISQSDLWKNFDVIAGTSIGGIAALAYASGITPDELEPFFTEVGPWIFTVRTAGDVIDGSINASLPSNRPSATEKAGMVLIGDDIYAAVDPINSNYGDARLKQEVINVFGTNTLQNLKTNTIIPTYRYDTSSFALYSNLNYAEFTGQNELISNVALATSAAPIYFPPIDISSHKYIDGGVYQNNPSQLALNLGKMLKPTANRYCVLSLGTGLGEMGFDVALARKKVLSSLLRARTPTETVELLMSLFDIGITGGQESVAKALSLESKYTLDNLYYYRFQLDLDQTQDTELDNSDPEFISYMYTTAVQYFNEDIENISNFIGHLTA